MTKSEGGFHTPDPAWRPGRPIPSPVKEMVTLDMAGVPSTPAYKLLIGAIVPRPIALVSTVSPEGVGNLAPFSFFTGVSSAPPCVLICITRQPDGSKKDSLRNIESTGQFVVNTVGEWMVEPMNWCSAQYPYGVSEWEPAGFSPLPSVKVRPHRVQQSPIHMECEVLKTMEVGDGQVGSSTIVVGKIVMLHVHKPAYADGKILLDEIAPVARLGGLAYARTADVFELPRPKLPET